MASASPDLADLVLVAPFTDEIRNELIEAIPGLSDSRRNEMADMCWQVIANQVRVGAGFEAYQLSWELAQGNTNVNVDLHDITTRLLRVYAIKLHLDLETVRQKFESHQQTAL